MAISAARLQDRLAAPVGIWPLVVFRVGFGLLMLASTIRFMANGWVHEFYIAPVYHFPYLGFEWATPLPPAGMYTVFIGKAACALCIAFGLLYRPAAIGFFALFTYVELIDKTYYLNHHYFIALVSFLIIFLPLNRRASLDVALRPSLRADAAPAWTIGVLRAQVAIVYLFAGIAKLQPDWLLRAMPLSLWLPAHAGMPIVGPLFDHDATAYAMSWLGALYDLTIPFLLLWCRTRPLAFAAVVGFHVMTAALFPIGMFPWIMIVAALIFFDERDYRAIARRLGLADAARPKAQIIARPRHSAALILVPFIALQVLIPLRHVLYPGDVLWTEEGFRLSWRVMLVQKAGAVTYVVRDPETGRTWIVTPDQYLTRQQEQQMAFQPDMIAQFAHFIDAQARAQGHGDVEVRAEAYVAFNGRPSRLLIDPTFDLSAAPDTLLHRPWILPL